MARPPDLILGHPAFTYFMDRELGGPRLRLADQTNVKREDIRRTEFYGCSKEVLEESQGVAENNE